MHSSKAALATVAVILVAACSDSSTGTGTNATVQFNVATAARPAAGVALAVTGSPDTLTDGTNELVIDSAQMVLRDIKFHLADNTACNDEDDDSGGGDDDDGTPDQGPGDNIRMSHDGQGDEDEDCDELHIGPYLLDLPLDDGPARSFSLEIPAGTYREVKFKVHKATRSGDASFITAHPELEDRSVRVVGSYNGVPFVFTSDASANQESEFVPPITVDGTTATDLTLFVDISKWFVVNGTLVDPARANSEEPLASQVKDNIKASIRAFKDDDRDGDDDEGHGGGDD